MKLDSPWTVNTLKCCAPCREVSLFPAPLMKGSAGRLGLLWSPTNFPGCCPIRAEGQAAAGHTADEDHTPAARDERDVTEDGKTGTVQSALLCRTCIDCWVTDYREQITALKAQSAHKQM